MITLGNSIWSLKYLFEVEFKDGSTYKQNDKDTSQFNLKKVRIENGQEIISDGTAFTDIEKKIYQIKTFSLVNDKHRFTVDLTDGHFEMDGVITHIDHTVDQVVPVHLIPKVPFKLIYFRQHKHDMNVNYEQRKSNEIAHRIIYFFGWEFSISGKNYRQVVGIE